MVLNTENKKRLLITASTFPRWENDTEPRFILDYAKAMKKYYDVTVLAPAAIGAKEKEEVEGVSVIRYHYFFVHKWETLCYPGAIVPRIREKKIRILLVPFLFLSLYFKLMFILPQYDYVHAHWLIPQGIVQSFFRKPYIVTGHGGDVSAFNTGIFKNLKAWCMKKAVAVTVVSKYKKKELENMYSGIESHVVSMGVDMTTFNKEKNKIPNFGGQDCKKVVLYVGRLADIKGVDYLVNAMEQIDDAVLVIVGDGPEKDSLKRLAQKYENKVIFLGSKNHQELKQIYASSDVLVVPSVTDSKGAQEGLPTVIMEAFASKLPVIATKTGGIGDIVKDNVNGILVEEKDSKKIAEAIHKILKDEEYAKALAEEGYKVAEEHDYTIVADKYYRLIEGCRENGKNT